MAAHDSRLGITSMSRPAEGPRRLRHSHQPWPDRRPNTLLLQRTAPFDIVQYCNKPKKGKRSPDRPSVPSCSVVSRPSLTVAARAASLDTPCVRDGVSILPVGARESLRRGRTREMTKRGGSRIRSITSSLCLCCRDERTPENKRSLPRGCSGDRWRRPSDRNPNGPRPAA